VSETILFVFVFVVVVVIVRVHVVGAIGSGGGFATLVGRWPRLGGREGRAGGVFCIIVVAVLVAVGPSAERLAAESMALEMTYEEILTNKGAIALVATEDARLVVVELVAQKMVGTGVALCASGLVARVAHLGRRRVLAHHGGESGTIVGTAARKRGGVKLDATVLEARWWD
jgi:hypothetical protein